jgi:hypothetical protein
MENGDRMSRTKQLCRLEQGGSPIAFLLTDMESGGFELTLIRSDMSGREVRSFRIRERDRHCPGPGDTSLSRAVRNRQGRRK